MRVDDCKITRIKRKGETEARNNRQTLLEQANNTLFLIHNDEF